MQLGGLPLAVNPPFKRMKNLHLNMNISLCCQHYQLLFPMNVPKAEKPYCNLFENFIFNVFSFTLSFILVQLDNPVQFLCLSGDDLTLSVCYKKGNDTIMALFDVPTFGSTVSCFGNLLLSF